MTKAIAELTEAIGQKADAAASDKSIKDIMAKHHEHQGHHEKLSSTVGQSIKDIMAKHQEHRGDHEKLSSTVDQSIKDIMAKHQEHRGHHEKLSSTVGDIMAKHQEHRGHHEMLSTTVGQSIKDIMARHDEHQGRHDDLIAKVEAKLCHSIFMEKLEELQESLEDKVDTAALDERIDELHIAKLLKKTEAEETFAKRSEVSEVRTLVGQKADGAVLNKSINDMRESYATLEAVEANTAQIEENFSNIEANYSKLGALQSTFATKDFVDHHFHHFVTKPSLTAHLNEFVTCVALEDTYVKQVDFQADLNDYATKVHVEDHYVKKACLQADMEARDKAAAAKLLRRRPGKQPIMRKLQQRGR